MDILLLLELGLMGSGQFQRLEEALSVDQHRTNAENAGLLLLKGR
jgi:hypothetical protein